MTNSNGPLIIVIKPTAEYRFHETKL